MQLIDGKATAAAIKEQIAQEVAQIVAAGGKQPHLVAVLVGHDGGSETYVKNKVLACEKCGFKSTLIRYEEDVTEEQSYRKSVEQYIRFYNELRPHRTLKYKPPQAFEEAYWERL